MKAFRILGSLIVGLGVYVAATGLAVAQTAVTFSCTISGTAPNVSFNCAPSNPPAPGTPSCSLSATPSPLTMTSAGGTVALAATCSNFTPNTFAWSVSAGGTLAATTTNTGTNSGALLANSGSTALTVNFSVTATDTNTNSSASAGPTGISVPGSGLSSGSPPATGFCGQYSNVTPINEAYWNAGYTSSLVGGQVLTMAFQVPTATSVSISYANYTSSPLMRYVTLSPSACDFRLGTDPTGSTAPISSSNSGLGAVRGSLVPGTTYYLNVESVYAPTNYQLCKAGASCGDIIVIFN